MSLRVAHLVAENFKKLVAIEVTPEGNIVEIAGNNGEGKTSLLDAIWVALKGRGAAPPEPIRQGEEVCYLELDIGKYRIIRRFTRQDDGDYTDFLRVEDPEGLQYPKPQQTLDRLLGAIGFDPFAFVQLKPDKQAAALLELVTLEDDKGEPVDLAELRALDKRVYDTRRDVNRDLKQAEARLTALPTGEPLPVGNIEELRNQLTSAAEHNGNIERRKAGREAFQERMKADDARLADLQARIKQLEEEARELEADLNARQKQVDDAEALPDPIDTAAVSAALAAAEKNREANRELEMRDVVAKEVAELRGRSEQLTGRLEASEKLRQGALARAQMPIEGLGVDGDDDGLHVTYKGVPFVQISTAEQLRVSTAIAMAGNPELRILRISDGSLLDDKSMAILRDMATEHDFQLFVELVRPNETTGIILEDGRIRGQELEPKERAPKRKAKAQETPQLQGGETVTLPPAKKGSDPITVEEVGDVDGPVSQPAGELFEDPLTAPLDEEEAKRREGPAPKVWTLEEWAALPAARRAFLAKKGEGPAE